MVVLLFSLVLCSPLVERDINCSAATQAPTTCKRKKKNHCMLNKDHTVSFPTAATIPSFTVNDSVAAPQKSVTVCVKHASHRKSCTNLPHTHLLPSQVTVETPSRSAPFHTQLDTSLMRVGRALAGGNLQAIAKAVFSSDGLREQLLQKFTDALNN